ncbi:MAG: flagellar protein FlbB [Treponema sp.]|nr:flagellar protein FlbB [Treponema sp.]MBQ7167335.1 flagellar protein FlbB [Treponema sp.]
MSHAKALGKSILLLILIVILAVFGIIWFDYLGLIQAKHVVAPVYKLVGLQPQTSVAISSPKNMEELDLDNDRYAKRLEALDVRVEELDKREADIAKQEENNTQVAQELEDRQAAQEEREKTFNNEVKKYDDRDRNIETIVSNLRGMQPVRAVAILSDMDDQDIIDVLRKEQALYASSGSMGSYWLSLMDSTRAAEIQRKMANKPTSLD